MARRQPLPPQLDPVFTVRDALDHGVTPARLRSSDLIRPFHGVRQAADGTGADAVADRCRCLAPRLRRWQFFSHTTALALVGAPLPFDVAEQLHVSAHRPAREPRTIGVVGHRLQLREDATAWDPRGWRREHAARAWRQAGTLLTVPQLVVAGDFLITDPALGIDIGQLREECATMGDVPGARLSRALPLIRFGVRSPRETELRLAIVGAGLPEPEVNGVIRDARGRFVAEIDLLLRRYRVAVEYDGRVHAEDPRQFERDADRWDAIRAEGWEHVRILRHHMRDGARPAIAKIRAALARNA